MMMTTNEREFSDWCKDWTDEKLLEQILLLEHLTDDRYFVESVFCDDGNTLLDVLKTECVRRFAEQTGEKG